MRLLLSTLSGLTGKVMFAVAFVAAFVMSTQSSGQTITGFTPNNGAAGTTVTVAGSGFTGASAVAFNGITAAFFVQSDNLLITQVPAGATTGLISVTVGANTVSSVDTFYVQQSIPTLTSFTPTAGPIGTNVTINGTSLNLIDSVRFNGTLATFNFVSSTQITSIVPAGATTGLIEIFDNGTRYTSATDFTVTLGPPAITSFDPTSGPTGTVVTIVGANFNNASQVAFNGQIATYQVITNDTIRATVPATATTGRIRVITPGGTVQSFQNFTVTNTTPITLFGFNPTSGPVGTTVTITGQNLAGVTQLLFNGTPATITSQNANQIVTTVPVGATTGNIVAIAGAISATSNQVFTVTTSTGGVCLATQPGMMNPGANWQTINVPSARPTSFMFNAVAGSTYGFQTCGTRLNTVIRIYNQANVEVAMNDDNGPYCTGTAASLDFTAPLTGQYRVLVTEAPCTAISANVALQHRLISTVTSPTLTDFTPKSGPIGTLVSVTGFQLNNVTQVLIGSVPATQIVSQTATSILFPVPVGATSNKVVLNFATGSVSSVDSFMVVGTTFCAPSAVLRGNINPTTSWQTVNAPAAGVSYWSFTASAGTTYSFSTCGATNDTKIYIYNSNRVAVDSNDNNGPLCAGNAASIEWTATSAGTYHVLVSNTGCTNLTAATNLRYRTGAAFTVFSIDPTSGTIGSTVTIKGNGFIGVTDVKFNNAVSAPGYTVANDSTITVAVPTGAQSGQICVYLGATKFACSPQNFTVITVPTLCSTERYQGQLTATTIVQYAALGAGFRDVYSFNATAGESYMLSTCDSPGPNDTKIRIYDAAGTVVADNDDNGPYCQTTKASLRFSPTVTGTYYLLVTDTDCNPMSSNGTLSYQQIPAALPPTITRFTPVNGPVGTSVTIYGTNLTLTNGVTFNGTAAVIFAIVNDTTVTATVPTGATTGRILLTTANGSALSASNFTVVNCNNARIAFQITPQGGNQFRVFGAGGPINQLTFTLDGNLFNAQQNFTAFVGIHTIRATNAQGCFTDLSFRNYGVVPCGQRISGGGTGADTLGFYEVAVPARGQSFLTLFDQGSVPERGRLFYNGAAFAALAPANNPTNLAFTNTNANAGTVVIEVKMRAGQTFGAWMNCPTFAASVIPLGQGTQTCSRQLVLSSYPNRLNSTSPFTVQVLNAGNGNVLQFNVRGLTLGAGDTLYLFNSIIVNNSPFATFTGNIANVTNPIVVSPDSIVTALFVGNAAGRGGFVIDVTCVSNTAQNTVMGTLSSSNLCPGSQFTAPYSLSGAFTTPVPLAVEASDSPFFNNIVVIGRDTVTSLSGSVAATVPVNAVSGTYYIRLRAATSSVSNSSAVAVTPQPIAPVIQPIGSANICQGSFLTVAPNSSGASGYIWSDGSTSRLLRTNLPGTYTLRIISGACTSDVSNPIVVTTKPLPVVRLRQSNDTIFINSPVPFDPTVSWFINGQPQVAFPSFWKVTQSGSYTATVNADGCFVNTDTITIVNLANGVSLQTFSLYPNPATHVVTIKADQQTLNYGQDLILMNALGQVVRSQSTRFASEDQMELNLDGLPAGQYWVSFAATPQLRKALIVR